ncbi:epoxyqueuosine reductase [Oxalobacteraceae bacterium GrIS 2.11]
MIASARMINDNGPLLAILIKTWGKDLGFSDVRITDVDLSKHEPELAAWIKAGYHGEMDYMATHGLKRARPAELVPRARRAIMVRMDYLPPGSQPDWREREQRAAQEPNQAVISIYARGRDYHKVLKTRLQKLADRIETEVGQYGYRVFTDSAPILEVALAEKAGLGWRGKHTLLLNQHAGSTFFIGEIITDIDLPVDPPVSNHCGSCSACITCCPTQAILGPYQLDARRCISYLTIELKGSIPHELRSLIGNRVYGCDDCQLYCPWNKFAQASDQAEFAVRNGLDQASMIELFSWDEAEFLKKMEGSPIRRIGHVRWLRNLAVGLGNAKRSQTLNGLTAEPINLALKTRLNNSSELVREHVIWALAQ